MATMNISLPDQMKSYAEAQAKDGRFANVSDYVRDLIRRDQARHDAMAEVQALIDEGMASGPAQRFDMAEFVTRQKSRVRD
jgi:antitoxin ParD1/3/4